MSLNERIAEVIEYSKLTPSEFADAIDVQRSSISHITSGRNKPSLEFIIKIKSRFPELLWDWIITGEGQMIDTKPNVDMEDSEINKQQIRTTSLPDLFTIMNQDDISKADNSINENVKQSPGESNIQPKAPAEGEICDSQRLENINEKKITQVSDNQNNNIKRIVIFYENGKFESFEP